MPSDAENVHLLWLIVSQKLVNEQLTDMDWPAIATGLGLEKAQAAQLRWSRLKKVLSETNGVPSKTEAGTAKTPKKPAAPRTKKTPAEKIEKGGKKPVTKKRKLDIEDHEEEDIKDELDEEFEGGRLRGIEHRDLGADGEEDELEV